MKKIGVLLNNLGPSQLNYYFIKSTNELLAKRTDLDIVVFYENLQVKCLPTNFASMPILEAWNFHGPMIATSLSTAAHLIRFPSSCKKIFYINDLEWIRLKNKNFSVLQSVYSSKELTLIARSNDHKNIIENCWNTKVIAVADRLEVKTFESFTFSS